MVTKSAQRREREKVEIQRRILDAARDLLNERGVGAVTMRALADRVEYTPAALYFHFRDKEALVGRLCDEDYAALGARFQVLARVADPLERLRMLARTYVTFALEHPHHYHLVFLTPRPEGPLPEGEAGASAPQRLTESSLLRAVTEAAGAGRFRRGAPAPALIARAIWEAIHGLVSLEVVGRGQRGSPGERRGGAAGTPPVEERLETMLALLLDGVARESA